MALLPAELAPFVLDRAAVRRRLDTVAAAIGIAPEQIDAAMLDPDGPALERLAWRYRLNWHWLMTGRGRTGRAI